VTHEQKAALDRAISPDRFGTYLAEAGGDLERARDLYVWDRDLSTAILADIAIVEVALRNAINNALTHSHGTEWYLKDVGFDDRSRRALTRAWRDLPKDRRTPGRVVAQLMLGFWVGLLDSGGYVGSEPQAFKMDYETLWRSTIRTAFRGGRVVASASGGRFSRSWTHEIAQTVLALRNRAAHHEPLVRGFPLPGTGTRLSVLDGHAACLRLVRTIDWDLEAWMIANTRVPSTLARRP